MNSTRLLLSLVLPATMAILIVIADHKPARAADGVCGVAADVPSHGRPNSNLCSVGTSTPVNTTGNIWGTPPYTGEVPAYWSWRCNPSGAGATVDCTAPVKYVFCGGTMNPSSPWQSCPNDLIAVSPAWSSSSNCTFSGGMVKEATLGNTCKSTAGQCGAANGVPASTVPPASSLCAQGFASGVSGSGPWSWTCDGIGGSYIDDHCNAPLLIVGTCGPANGTTVSSKPTSGLCGSGSPTTVSGSGPWTWDCNGNGSVNASCSANKIMPINGACGPANGQDLTAAPSGGDLCSAGSASTVAGTGPWSWTCSGANGGSDASCSATLCGGPPPVDAACGPADGQTYATATQVNAGGLCNPGTSANVSGSGPWNWTCAGENGGSNAACSAAVATTFNGSCKSYGGTYSSQPASTTSSGCTSGTYTDYTDTSAAWRWQCAGGGTPTGSTATCSASKIVAVNGVCKSYASTYSSQPASNTSTGCTAGSYADATDDSSSWKWTCQGSGGGSAATCSASKAPTEPCLPNDASPSGQSSCPTQSCFFWVSGTMPSERDSGTNEARIGGAHVSNIVGPGNYPDAAGDTTTPGPFLTAAMGSFDGIAIGSNTRVIIYDGPNYTGSVLLDQHGPKVLNNCLFYGTLTTVRDGRTCNDLLTMSWASQGGIFTQFTPATRSARSDMHGWGGTTLSLNPFSPNGDVTP